VIRVERPDGNRLAEEGINSWPIWEKEISEFPWEYDMEETCFILEGEAVITPEKGPSVTIKQGDLVTFPRGMKCRWRITEPIRKHYDFR
jgi:uncharacterized cupin superfamily protein